MLRNSTSLVWSCAAVQHKVMRSGEQLGTPIAELSILHEPVVPQVRRQAWRLAFDFKIDADHLDAVPSFPRFSGRRFPIALPTTHPGSHPVRLRPTLCGAVVVQGVKVERATVRTTLTPWAATARLCLGRRWSGWEPHDARHAPAGTRERRSSHPGV